MFTLFIQELKSRYGLGYNVQVRVKLDEDGNPDNTALCGFMRLNFPDATLEVSLSLSLSLSLPLSLYPSLCLFLVFLFAFSLEFFLVR